MEYKYTATFEMEAQASLTGVSEYLSEASLDQLSSLFPESVDLDKNIDLMGVAFNAAVVNKFNKNGDGIDSATAADINKYFIHKPTNIEHNRDQIVGHIVSAGFSRFGSNQIIDAAEMSSKNEPVNISLSAVVYKMAAPALAEMLDQDGASVSTSWELGFNEFAVAVGSTDLKDCEIYYGKDAEPYKECLTAFGGSGKTEDGKACSRLVVGEVYPLGVAFTTKPAADVSGVYVKNKNEKNNKELVGKNINKHIMENKSSQKQKTNVIENKELNQMDTEKLLDKLDALLDEKRRKNDFSEEAVASISKLVNDVIVEKSSEWKSQVEQAEADKLALEKSQAEISEQYEAIKQELDSAQEKLTNLEQEKSDRQTSEAFNNRMESLSSEYELEEGDLEIIASEVKSLDLTDEAFAAYKEKFEKIWAHKNKELIKTQAEKLQEQIEAEVQKRLQSKESDAAPEEVAEAALEQVEEDSADVPNNNSESIESEDSLTEKFEKAFSQENISIKY